MPFLRCVSPSLAGVELPLLEPAANTLIDALLSSSLAERAVVLSTGLRRSPCLLIWVVDRCLAKEASLGTQPTIGGLAQRVAENLVRTLDDSLVRDRADHEEAYGEDRRQRVKIQEATPRCVAAVEVARRATESLDAGRSPASRTAEFAYLLGLLHNLGDYLSPTQPGTQREKLSARSLLKQLEPHLGPLRSAEMQLAAEAVAKGWAEWMRDRAEVDERHLVGEQKSAGEEIAAGRLIALNEALCRLERLETEFDVALEEAKLQAMYKLAAGAGHEINNPLGSIAGRAQLLLRDETEPERRRTLAKINSQAFRAHEMIADMMLFARPPVPRFEEIAPAALIGGLTDELEEIAHQRDAKIISYITEEIATLRVDAAQLRVALRAMCINALEATGLGGRIEITVARGPTDKVLAVRSSPVATVQITVRDNGPGFSEEERLHLFDPFYSGREAGRGLGFGLSKCWRIVQQSRRPHRCAK